MIVNKAIETNLQYDIKEVKDLLNKENWSYRVELNKVIDTGYLAELIDCAHCNGIKTYFGTILKNGRRITIIEFEGGKK